VRFGKAHGQAEDYGHIDFLVGRRAPDEVWPTITRWLEAGVEGERKTA